MKRPNVWTRAFFASSVLCLVSAPILHAQTAAAPAATADDQPDEAPIVLSPFVVDASQDTGSYRASSTLAGTRVRTDLKDVASAISVVTKQFLSDTGATGSETLLTYTGNTEVGGVRGNFSGVSASSGQYNEAGVLLRPSNNTRVRGLDAADNTRDYFLTDIPWDSYIVDRVDLQRGPNSILFGVGSPAGIVNSSVNTAGFKNAYSIENRVDKWGSLRNSVDLNYVLRKNELSVRIAALDDRRKFEQDPAEENVSRAFAAIRYEPKLFAGGTTSIRANYEHGEIDANRPRTLPPVDTITPWFLTGYTKDINGNNAFANLNKRLQDPSTQDRSRTAGPADAGGLVDYGKYPWYGSSSVGRQFWESTVAYYDDRGNGTASRYVSPMVSTNNGISSTGVIDGSIGGLQFRRPFSINNFDDVANKAGDSVFPGAAYYTDKSLTDPSIFNFFDLLIDGPNKKEWQNWDAYNVALAQTFLDGRVGGEFVYDVQRYNDGQIGFLGGGGDYTIGVDINSHLADGSPNPNVGRPYVASSTEGNNRSTDIDRDGMRFTAFAELRADDFLSKGRLSEILGRHVITGLMSQDLRKAFELRWAQSAATPDYPNTIGEGASLQNHVVAYDWQVYLGDSLLNAASAQGANIDRIRTVIQTPEYANLRFFNNNWDRPTNPNSPDYVDPAAPFTYVESDGDTIQSTQSENPANYVGWSEMLVPFRSVDRGDKESLLTSAAKERQKVKSRGITWQGYMFGGNFVPVFGWRRDEVSFRAGDALANQATGTVNRHFDYDNARNRIVAGESKSWGGVLHMPQSWADKLPGSTRLSLTYNRSENFKADAPRQDVFGQTIANPIGKTKEYGFVMSTLNDKLSLKVNWYETRVQNATLPGDTGFNYLHWAVPAWGVAHVAAAQAGLAGLNDNNAWLWNYAGGTAAHGDPAWENHPQTVVLKNAVAAWKNLPLDQQFFNSYGNELAQIDASKVKAGDYMGAWPKWAQGRADPQPGSAANRVASADTTSKGVEYELTAQPIRNWNITANVSKVKAVRTSVSPTIAAYMDQMTDFLAGPAGDLKIWGGGDPFRKVWADEAVSRYNVLLTQIGSSAPEIPPWRGNLITTYAIDRGSLKGLFFGGAYRWEDKRILGYRYDSDLKALDVNQPLYGPTDDHFDLWVGYTRRIFGQYDWRIQLNVYNMGEDTRLVPTSLQPDGSPAISRIQEGMRWQLTNSITF